MKARDSKFCILISGQCLKNKQPDFVTPLRDITVEVGKNATFECFVTNIDSYRVSKQNFERKQNNLFKKINRVEE